MGSDGPRQAATLYEDLTALDVQGLSWTIRAGSWRERRGGCSLEVVARWTIPEFGSRVAASSLTLDVADAGGRARLTAIRPSAGSATPMWLLPALQVRRATRVLVASSDPALTASVMGRLLTAVGDVSRVLPGWHGDLVAVVPASGSAFDALTRSTPAGDRGIAAVTTTADGSLSLAAPDLVVVNPTVFAGLGPVGAHVVLSHEATHAATEAAAVTMPPWLVEGFADYVGIGSVGLPTPVAAARAIARARTLGVPDALPGPSAFGATGTALEATYEDAWLAASLIARTYGQSRLVALYRVVERHRAGVAAAFHQVLGTSLSAFTAAWRRELVGLAAHD